MYFENSPGKQRGGTAKIEAPGADKSFPVELSDAIQILFKVFIPAVEGDRVVSPQVLHIECPQIKIPRQVEHFPQRRNVTAGEYDRVSPTRAVVLFAPGETMEQRQARRV